MKVLQINAVYRVGSTGRNVYELHTAMQKKGIESYIGSTHMDDTDKNCYQIGSPVDWKLHGLFSRISGLQGYFSARATKRFLKYIEEIKPDIVHLNNVHANYINLPILFNYLKKNDIATVITLHDCWFYTGKCTHYTVEGCDKWKTGCGNCPNVRKDNKSWFFDRTLKMWKDKKNWYEAIPRLAVIGVSNWIIDEAKCSILKTATVMERIYNWIDMDLFRQVKTEKLRDTFKLNGKFVILGVASKWDNRKGLDAFIELANKLEPDKVIILVGQLIDKVLPKNIIHINATNNLNELVKLYSLADVFLQLSLQESFGKVVAEALACGTPIITVDSTANRELVSEKCGIVLPTLDIEGIKKAIHEIQEKGKEYYSCECRLFAEKSFRSEKNIDEYISIYKQLNCQL